MDGYGWRGARGGSRGRRPHPIALTGWGEEEDRRRSRDAGIDHHLVKPVDFAALEDLLRSLQTR